MGIEINLRVEPRKLASTEEAPYFAAPQLCFKDLLS